MKKLFVCLSLLLLSINIVAQDIQLQEQNSVPDTLTVSQRFRAQMDSLIMSMQNDMEVTYGDISDNPLYYKLFMPLVLYRSVVSEAITPDDDTNQPNDDLLPISPINDDYNEQTLVKMIDEALVKVYLEHPELVQMTEEELMGIPGIQQISNDMRSGINLSTVANGRRPSSNNAPEVVISKRRYWKTFGNFQGKYTQSYYSDNWYKGGESNHSVLGQINLEAKYAKNQTTLDNKLEMKLGYYTTEIDGKTTFRTNDDLLRFTSKFGLKAWQSWYYTAQFQGYTQFMDVFDTKVTTKLKSKFMAPAYGNLSIGMDYKPQFKNKNITLSVLLSPLSYNCRYVSVDSIATNFGIEKGKNFKYTIGSRFEGNLKWKFLNDFTWTSKAQFYTSYESVEMNFENTVDYKLSKYLSLQFFCHWRFDDSVKRKKDKDGELMGYGQFKEFLTLNFNYAW